MKVEIPGMGCLSCENFFEHAQAAVRELNITAEVVTGDDIKKIIA